MTDGVFIQEEPGGPVEFYDLPPPTDEEIAEVAQEVCRKTIELLKSKGLWKDEESDTEDSFADKEPALAHAYQASVRGVLSTGPRSGQRVVRFFGAAARNEKDTRKRSTSAFDIHARRSTFAHDRAAVERLARYILRPPLSQNSLERLSDGRVVLRLKRAWTDGTTAVVFEPLDLMSKLTALIPRPRANILRFHGVCRAEFQTAVWCCSNPANPRCLRTHDRHGSKAKEPSFTLGSIARKSFPGGCFSLPQMRLADVADQLDSEYRDHPKDSHIDGFGHGAAGTKSSQICSVQLTENPKPTGLSHSRNSQKTPFKTPFQQEFPTQRPRWNDPSPQRSSREP